MVAQAVHPSVSPKEGYKRQNSVPLQASEVELSCHKREDTGLKSRQKSKEWQAAPGLSGVKWLYRPGEVHYGDKGCQAGKG